MVSVIAQFQLLDIKCNHWLGNLRSMMVNGSVRGSTLSLPVILVIHQSVSYRHEGFSASSIGQQIFIPLDIPCCPEVTLRWIMADVINAQTSISQCWFLLVKISWILCCVLTLGPTVPTLLILHCLIVRYKLCLICAKPFSFISCVTLEFTFYPWNLNSVFSACGEK